MLGQGRKGEAEVHSTSAQPLVHPTDQLLPNGGPRARSPERSPSRMATKTVLRLLLISAPRATSQTGVFQPCQPIPTIRPNYPPCQILPQSLTTVHFQLKLPLLMFSETHL